MWNLTPTSNPSVKICATEKIGKIFNRSMLFPEIRLNYKITNSDL